MASSGRAEQENGLGAGQVEKYAAGEELSYMGQQREDSEHNGEGMNRKQDLALRFCPWVSDLGNKG